MKTKKNSVTVIFSVLIMLVLILDSKYALQGVSEGIELCLKTVIPSLFPFFILSGLITGAIAGRAFPVLRPLGKLCGIPKGGESFLLLGMIGGYPVGAHCISNAYHCKVLNKADAERMLGFCNNAGPAFIFGMGGLLFPDKRCAWVLWGIQILCVILTGILLPGKSQSECTIPVQNSVSFSDVMKNAIQAMSTVCGWVIAFRVILAILNRWLLWLITQNAAVLICGMLELSNGVILLYNAENLLFRFVAASYMMTFGGLCVALQTQSAAKSISCKKYYIGKLLQLSLCIPLSLLFAGLLFPGNRAVILLGICIFAAIIITCLGLKVFQNYTGNSNVYRV